MCLCGVIVTGIVAYRRRVGGPIRWTLRDPLSLVPCNPRGFYCPEAPPQSCFGTDGLDITDSVGVTYDVFTSEDLLWRHLGIIWILQLSRGQV